MTREQFFDMLQARRRYHLRRLFQEDETARGLARKLDMHPSTSAACWPAHGRSARSARGRSRSTTAFPLAVSTWRLDHERQMATLRMVQQRSTQPGRLPMAHGLARTEAGAMTDDEIFYTCAVLMMALFSTLFWLLKK